MPIGMISAEGVSVRRSSGKPRLLLRGRRRKAVINLKNQIDVLVNQEFAENRRAAINGYNAFFVLGAANSQFNTWLGKIALRLEEALAAKI